MNTQSWAVKLYAHRVKPRPSRVVCSRIINAHARAVHETSGSTVELPSKSSTDAQRRNLLPNKAACVRASRRRRRFFARLLKIYSNRQRVSIEIEINYYSFV